MCGIIGILNNREAKKLVKKGLDILKYRGRDNAGIYSNKDICIGHRLHSVVSFVKQPLIDKGIFVSNCEIYNWKELNEKYKLNAKNDSGLLFGLLELKNVKEILDELDGVYAFAYLRDNKLILARDILGEKPLWYSCVNGFSFASEKKALEKIGFIDVYELSPRNILIYDVKEGKVDFIQREFFNIKPEIKDKESIIIKKLDSLLIDAVKKRVPERKLGLLFSGGLDSSLIALILKKLNYSFTCYTAVLDDNNLKEAEDLDYAIKVAKELNLELKIIKVKLKNIEKYLKIIVPLIEDYNVVKVGVALTFFVACEGARKDKCKVIFSGLGSEELFAGYERHKNSLDINKECLSGLIKMYERDLYRDDVITMYNNLELRLPFLDKELIEYTLKIDGKLKLKCDVNKYILRETAKKIGLKKEFAERKKKAAQYGSNFHKALKKLSKGNRNISDYLKQFYSNHNLKFGALVSSGKDSIYAMYVMMKQNYDVKCMINVKSQNLDSYMFHSINADMVKLQSESISIPLIQYESKGEKEKELEDLKKALEIAKEKYKIEGIITGALYSNYQRERIEKVADSLGLKIFAPLWHINQETEIREVIKNGFEFILVKVSAEGLDKSWLNKIIDENDVDKLVLLNKKNGLNVSGEGGEYESLMLNGPIFKKKIKIIGSEIKEDGILAELIIKKAVLE